MNWISVKDKLPEFEQLVLVADCNTSNLPCIGRLTSVTTRKDIITTEWSEANSYDSIWFDVTHWMPIPEKPTP